MGVKQEVLYLLKQVIFVAGDKMGPSKRTKAEGLGVPIISEQDFLAMLS